MRNTEYQRVQRQNTRRFKQFSKENQKILRGQGYHNRGKVKVFASRDLLNSFELSLNDPEVKLAKQLEECINTSYANIERLKTETVEKEIKKLNHSFFSYQNKLDILCSKLSHCYQSKMAKGEDLDLRSEELALRADTIHQLQKDLCKAQNDSHTNLCRLFIGQPPILAA